MSVKVVAGIRAMNKQGHEAHLCKRDGFTWVEIDHRMLASFQEMEDLVDGKQTFENMAEHFEKRFAQEPGTI
jgi:hypothetical protein